MEGSLWAFLKFTISHLSLFGTAFVSSRFSCFFALMGVKGVTIHSIKFNLFIGFLVPCLMYPLEGN